MVRRWYCVRCQQTVRESRSCPCSIRSCDIEEQIDLNSVEELVKKFLAHAKSLVDSNDAMGVDWEDLANDSGTNFGAGFCEDASSDLAKWAHANSLRAAAVGGFIGAGYLPIWSRASPFGYPARVKGETHWICVLLFGQKKFAVDLTARQFSPKLAFPMIWEI